MNNVADMASLLLGDCLEDGDMGNGRYEDLRSFK
jgi:hypothetical protein